MARISLLSRPVPATAVLWDGSDASFDEIKAFVGSIVVKSGPGVTFYDKISRSERHLHLGDYVVRTSDGFEALTAGQMEARFVPVEPPEAERVPADVEPEVVEPAPEA